MYLEVYIDVIFIINFIMDFILLYMVKMTLKLKSSFIRLILGAIFGAISACILTIFPNINIYLQFLFSYIVITTIMIIIAFSTKKKGLIIKACLLLYISTFFLGGILNSLYYHTRLGYYFTKLISGDLAITPTIPYLIISIIALTIGVRLFIRLLNNLRSGEQPVYQTELHLNGKKSTLLGLLDTGNNLYDPITRKPVLVMDMEELCSLLSQEEMEYILSIVDELNGTSNIRRKENSSLQTYDNMAEHLKIRMIPFHSIGKSGMLPAILMDQVIIWNEKEQIVNKNVLIAFSENRISKQNEYRIILHRAIM